MKILVTGNTGYIGPVLAQVLRAALPDAQLIGYDSAFFAHCLTNADYLPELDYDQQHWGDIRTFPDTMLAGVDAVIHLAAVSNDPMGKRFEQVTEDINYRASIRLAQQAKANGVRSFVFASSCSMYGYAEGGPRRETDALNPLTAYARSKVATEQDLVSMADADFAVTSLRFATACGMSTRLRLDLVLNDFVACALSSKVITVLSDGSPWRPLIDVKDMSRAMLWAVQRPAERGGHFVAVNTGSSEWNYQVRDLAAAVAAAVRGTDVSINADAPPDKRSYRVDFSLFKQLAPDYQPQIDLQASIEALVEGLSGMRFSQADFRNTWFMRLRVLEAHIASGRLTENLHWTGHRCR